MLFILFSKSKMQSRDIHMQWTVVIAAQLIHDDTEFDTIEAAYQYTKATRFHDKACANNIILAKSPSEAKSLGSNVKGFN